PSSFADTTNLSPIYVSGDRAGIWLSARVLEGERRQGWLTVGVPIRMRGLEADNPLVGPGADCGLTTRGGGPWLSLTERGLDGVPEIVEPGTIVEFDDPAGSAHVLCVDSIVRTPWLIASSLPAASMYAPARGFLERAAMVGLLLMLAGAGGEWLLIRRIPAPLSR